MAKPAMSLKQFMLRQEILSLYRSYMRLGRLLIPPKESPAGTTDTMRAEWVDWVRSEFRLRQRPNTDEEATKMLLAHGKRQLKELERTIVLATNRNAPVAGSSETHQNQNDNNKSSADNASQSSPNGKNCSSAHNNSQSKSSTPSQTQSNTKT